MQYLYPQGKKYALTFSYDDGQYFDRQLVDVFNRYGMKATFHLNSARLGSGAEGELFVGRDEVKTLYAGHEVACHGVEHRNPLILTKQQMLQELLDDRKELERITGGFVQGLSYAYGAYGPEVETVADVVGLKYSRTVNTTHGFNIPVNFLEWNPTCHHADPRLMELGRDLLNSPDWREIPLMYVWGHSFEFGRGNNWEIMEEFCKQMQGHDEVWYATNIEIYQYVNAMRGLIYSANGKKVYNPSVVSVWIKDGGQVVEIQPGMTVELG